MEIFNKKNDGNQFALIRGDKITMVFDSFSEAKANARGGYLIMRFSSLIEVKVVDTIAERHFETSHTIGSEDD